MANKSSSALLPNRKTVLITGSAQRIGKAIALGFAEKQWNVMLHYHQSHEAAEALVKTIAAQGGTDMYFAADLSQEQETADLIPIIAKTIQKPIDCLVNNASIFERDDAATATNSDLGRRVERVREFPLRIPVSCESIPNRSGMCRAGSAPPSYSSERVLRQC